MQVEHPIARQDQGVVDDEIDVAGETVPVENGTFEVPDSARGWLQAWANSYGYDPYELVVDETETCDVVKTDGEVCGRELPCPYHSED